MEGVHMAAPAEPSQSTTQGLPYPTQDQPPGSGYHYIQRLAEATQQLIVGVYPSTSARDIENPSAQRGTLAYTQDQGILWLRGYSGWDQIYPTAGPSITSGSSNPSGGQNGDIYFKYI